MGMENRIEKFHEAVTKAANAAEDIDLINRHSVRTLAPDEVFCFSVILCDNEVDRDYDFFSDSCLETLAPLFVGKTVISDHYWSSKGQVARLYKVEVENGKGKNSRKEQYKVLRGFAYMLNTESTKPTVDAIEAGILKEVSVGFAAEPPVCSICNEPLEFDWKSWAYQCKNGHRKGEKYERQLCCGRFDKATDAYELSFVAVPAQPGAGVTKAADMLKAENEKLKTLVSEYERKERERILANNKAYLEKYSKS